MSSKISKLEGNRCKKCLADSLRMSIDRVCFEAKKRGHKLLSKTYTVAKAKLKFRCSKGHVFWTTWDRYSTAPKRGKRSNGCAQCGYLANSLSSNYNYRGYRWVKTWIRDRLKEWKKRALAEADYKCFVTGERGVVLEIHHPENFSTIFYQAIAELDLPDLPTIGDYSEDELFELEQRVQELHGRGVPLRKDIHKLFHETYGKKDNTWPQLLEFRERYKANEFKAAQ